MQPSIHVTESKFRFMYGCVIHLTHILDYGPLHLYKHQKFMDIFILPSLSVPVITHKRGKSVDKIQAKVVRQRICE